jgi:hypothetical protein
MNSKKIPLSDAISSFKGLLHEYPDVLKQLKCFFLELGLEEF